MRTNEFKLEAKVLGDVKTKTFDSGKVIHEWAVGIGAKQQDGTWKNVFLSCKKWGGQAPSRGDIITMSGQLTAETWGEDKSKLVLNVKSVEGLSDSFDPHTSGFDAPVTDESKLPF